MSDSNFRMPMDPKKISGKIFVIAIIAAMGLAFYNYLLPILVSMAWNTIQLIAGCVIGGFLLMIVTSKKFWRGLSYFAEGIAQWTLGLAIEMNPFLILYARLEQAEKDRKQLYKQCENLKAQQSSLSSQLFEKDAIMKKAAKEIELVNKVLINNPTDFDSQLLLETANSNFNNAKSFIDKVKPISNDIDFLVDYTDKAYRKSGILLENQKNEVMVEKAAFDAITAGSSAMTRAMAAFNGNPELNADARKALDVLRKNVFTKIGTVRQAIQITGQFMNKMDLADAAQISMAAETAKQFNLDQKFQYSKSVDAKSPVLLNQSGGSPGQAVNNGNKYNKFL